MKFLPRAIINGLVFLTGTLLSYAQYTETINSNRPGASQGAFPSEPESYSLKEEGILAMTPIPFAERIQIYWVQNMPYVTAYFLNRLS